MNEKHIGPVGSAPGERRGATIAPDFGGAPETFRAERFGGGDQVRGDLDIMMRSGGLLAAFPVSRELRDLLQQSDPLADFAPRLERLYTMDMADTAKIARTLEVLATKITLIEEFISLLQKASEAMRAIYQREASASGLGPVKEDQEGRRTIFTRFGRAVDYLRDIESQYRKRIVAFSSTPVRIPKQ